MRNTTKRRYGTLFFASALVFFGHWFDFFYMIKPGVFITAKEAMAHGAEGGQEAGGHTAEQAVSFVSGFTIPGLIEIGVFLGFTAFFLFWVFNQMAKSPLLPLNDPYLEESLHHEVQAYE